MDTWYLGILAGLATAILWTITALAFEDASRRLGSLVVNLLRLLLAAVFFLALSLIRTGTPTDPALDREAWLWLSLSGLVGFVLGDLLLFEAFVQTGSRLSMLVYSGAPPLAAILAWVFLDETMPPLAILGMVLTLGGISMAVIWRPAKPGEGELPPLPLRKGGPVLPDRVAVQEIRQEEQHRVKGSIMAGFAALAQAGGVVLAKHGAGSINSFAATQVRVLAGIAGFVVIFTLTGRWGAMVRAVAGLNKKSLHVQSHRRAWLFMALGALMGPFLGVSLGLASTQLTTAGVATTLMALVPVLIIPPSVLLFREKTSPGEIIGALVAVAGIGLMFL